MPENSQMICITCPKGCSLEVTHEGATVIKVLKGCKRGREYVQRELSDPRRMVASTVRIRGGVHPLLPVYTAEPFPKPRIRALMEALRAVEVQAPVEVGQVVVANVLDSGVDILASRGMTAHGG